MTQILKSIRLFCDKQNIERKYHKKTNNWKNMNIISMLECYQGEWAWTEIKHKKTPVLEKKCCVPRTKVCEWCKDVKIKYVWLFRKLIICFCFSKLPSLALGQCWVIREKNVYFCDLHLESFLISVFVPAILSPEGDLSFIWALGHDSS